MIIGVGTDIVAVARIGQILHRRGERFLQRVLAVGERASFDAVAARDRPRWLAKRWAAKEAFGKAFGTGIAAPLTFAGIATDHDADGRPYLMLSPVIEEYLARRGVARCHLSLSDETDYALAFVILEGYSGQAALQMRHA